MKHPLAITTFTLIRTKEEEKIVFESVKTLSALNIPVVIVDGGSTREQKEYLKKLPNIIFFESSNGLFDQVKLSLTEGAKVADALFYLHTDKIDFIKTYVKLFIDHYATLPKDSMLIPTRTKESFATYPELQRYTEEFLNDVLSRYMGVTNDYYYGVKIVPSRLVNYLSLVQGNIGWGVEAFCYALQKRLGLPYFFKEVSIQSPKDIGSSDEIFNYRMLIVKDQLDGLLQGMKVKLNNEK